MPELSLSAREARRIAIASQGLASAPPSRTPGRRSLETLAGRLGALQLDSVNVLARSHYLPAFSRLGPYDRGLLDRTAWGSTPALFEYWGHEASLMPVDLQPLFRWRMARARRGETWGGLARFARERGDFVRRVLDRVREEGPLTGGDVAEARRPAGWWNWSEGKQALEWLFWTGEITTRTRRGFERVYDLTERVLPPGILAAPTPSEAEAHRALALIAARAMGVATAGDLRDYFRLPAEGFARRLAELVEEGGLIPVSVEGWRQAAYLFADHPPARPCRGQALLSPFDSLIWRRERAERLFGARIRLEVYTPAEKRIFGYYVLPFLAGERILARVDLKADRAARILRVQSAHLEPGATPSATAPPLAETLVRMAGWLDLNEVAVAPNGGLAAALAAALP